MLYESTYYGISGLGDDSLYHHGIKGQKWGVRRYQNPDGSLTEEGRLRQKCGRRVKRSAASTEDVEDIINGMSKKEQSYILAGSDHYLNLEERSNIAKRVVIKDKVGKPVSFFDLLEDGDDLQVALGTRSGEQYRGKGYATRATQNAMRWLERNAERIPQKRAVWGVNVNNVASIKIAKQNGFKIDEQSYSKDKEWVNYVKPIGNTKKR